MKNKELAQKLLDWNAKNLIASADLKKSEIGNFFSEAFEVRANGRVYEADEDNYFDFLNQFRSTIQSIRYHCFDFISEKNSVAIPLTAHIVRTNGLEETFEAILILKFDQESKIILWHEVYLKI